MLTLLLFILQLTPLYLKKLSILHSLIVAGNSPSLLFPFFFHSSHLILHLLHEQNEDIIFLSELRI